MREQMWLVWSIEHNAWWREHAQGYTDKKELAGVYSWVEALAIVRDANRHAKNTPNEALVPE